jgi:hypothetical protein
MKRLTLIAAAALVLAFAGPAGAALSPSVFDPGSTGCPVATYANGVLHLEKNCATTTNASAGAAITGLDGQPFTSASFTLAGTSQCQGGSPRFDIVTASATFFLGCNNVTPVINADGSATYTFTPAALAAAGLPVPTGTITAADVLVDVQGKADVSKISVNGIAQVPASTGPTSKDACKHGGWKTFTNPSFKNQGQCVRFVEHAKHDDKGRHKGSGKHDEAGQSKQNDQGRQAHGEKHHR